MPSLKERLAQLVEVIPGLTDRELADRLVGAKAPQQPVNQAARSLASVGVVRRLPRPDGKIGNFPAGIPEPTPRTTEELAIARGESGWPAEDGVKRHVQTWLEAAGWRVNVVWGRGHGIDVDAVRAEERWRIEVKGGGSRGAMRVNYFLAVLGELLQRMDDPTARYSVALPDLPQFRGLWSRLPALAKFRTGFTALFVDPSGGVVEMS